MPKDELADARPAAPVPLGYRWVLAGGRIQAVVFWAKRLE
jgi:hypothetical protein